MTEIHDAAITYGSYFSALGKISALLDSSVHLLHEDGRNQELVEAGLRDTLARLSHTGHALHLKYAFTHASLTGERLNIAPNGFPHKGEIDGMVIDLMHREDNLKPLVSVRAQKQAWIEHALREHEDDPDILWRIGERRYLDMLEPSKMLAPVITGSIEFQGMTENGERKYSFWWSCYSSRDHCPCVHVLELTQDDREDIDRLEEGGPAWVAFLQVIRSRGHRTSSVSVMASDIDSALSYIHPKRLTRLTFEQLYTQLLVDEIDEPTEEDKAAIKYFSDFAEDDEFILVFWRDTVESKGAREPGMMSFGRQRAEIFDLDQSVDAAYERGATWSSRMLLIPHRFAQIVHSPRGKKLAPLFDEVDQKLVYSSGGKIDAI